MFNWKARPALSSPSFLQAAVRSSQLCAQNQRGKPGGKCWDISRQQQGGQISAQNEDEDGLYHPRRADIGHAGGHIQKRSGGRSDVHAAAIVYQHRTHLVGVYPQLPAQGDEQRGAEHGGAGVVHNHANKYQKNIDHQQDDHAAKDVE